MSNKRYSVLLPLYKGDYPEFLKVAIESMLAQTIPPDEILVAIDGPISKELEDVVNHYTLEYSSIFNVMRSEKNVGLGKLLNKALPMCRNEFIARMDADDYSLPNRIEKQFLVLDKNPEINVVGSNVDEFIGELENTIAHVILPEHHADIYKFAKKRCPIRHPSLLYKKSDVISSGNYSTEDLIQNYVQDYDLIVKMIENDYKIYNIQEPLVRMRTSTDFYKRRGGWAYLKCIYKAKRNFYNLGFFSKKDFLISFGGHAIVMLMPGWLRSFVYNTFLRD